MVNGGEVRLFGLLGKDRERKRRSFPSGCNPPTFGNLRLRSFFYLLESSNVTSSLSTLRTLQARVNSHSQPRLQSVLMVGGERSGRAGGCESPP